MINTKKLGNYERKHVFATLSTGPPCSPGARSMQQKGLPVSIVNSLYSQNFWVASIRHHSLLGSFANSRT